MQAKLGVITAVILLASFSLSEACSRIRTTKDLNLQEVVGTWYVIRMIGHSSERTNVTKKSSTCSSMNITTGPSNAINLGGVSLFYNETDKGFWDNPNLKGTVGIHRVQITFPKDKKVRDFMGATTCREDKMTTLVLSKSPKYSSKRADYISKRLEKQGLRVDVKSNRCKSESKSSEQ